MSASRSRAFRDKVAFPPSPRGKRKSRGSRFTRDRGLGWERRFNRCLCFDQRWRSSMIYFRSSSFRYLVESSWILVIERCWIPIEALFDVTPPASRFRVMLATIFSTASCAPPEIRRRWRRCRGTGGPERSERSAAARLDILYTGDGHFSCLKVVSSRRRVPRQGRTRCALRRKSIIGPFDRQPRSQRRH